MLSYLLSSHSTYLLSSYSSSAVHRVAHGVFAFVSSIVANANRLTTVSLQCSETISYQLETLAHRTSSSNGTFVYFAGVISCSWISNFWFFAAEYRQINHEFCESFCSLLDFLALAFRVSASSNRAASSSDGIAALVSASAHTRLPCVAAVHSTTQS